MLEMPKDRTVRFRAQPVLLRALVEHASTRGMTLSELMRIAAREKVGLD